MSTLYIDRKDVELRLDGKTIACYENGKRTGTIPITHIEHMVLKGDVTLHANLLGKLGKNGTGIVFLSGRKNETSLLFPTPHHDARRRITQYHLSTDDGYCRNFSQGLVRMKVSAQHGFLQELKNKHRDARHDLARSISKLENILISLEGEHDIPSLRGLEGTAAASYFEGLSTVIPPALNFKGRNRRPPKDPFNAVISLGYTLLTAKITMMIYSAGIDPYIGFYHALDFARESLACDLTEPFRTEIDKFCLGLFKEKIIRPEDFSTVDGACLMNKTSRIAFYRHYTLFFDELKAKIKETIDKLCHDINSKSDLIFPQTRANSTIMSSEDEADPTFETIGIECKGEVD